MTSPFSDEPQALQPSADLVAEPQIESSNSDDPQEASVAHISTSEYSPPDSIEQAPSPEEPPLFSNVFQPQPPPPPVRIPHLGHVALLAVYLLFSLIVSVAILRVAVYFHLFNVFTLQDAVNDIHYALGSEILLYLGAFAAAYFTFPLIWRKSFFAGLQWNGATAWRNIWALVGTGFLCYLAAMVNMILVPGPSNTPIEKIFKEPGAAWLLFFFGITFAPFFEELFFRGFLLPSLCTSYDWLAEKFYKVPRRSLAPDGSPQWSLSAMAIASIVTSVPFAMMHAEQIGNSIDGILLLGCVSVALCAVRLITRSLAASVVVHAFYNLLLFSMMVVVTEGFRHLDKM
jgi:membrane protease YdiL (CAAX protease family)